MADVETLKGIPIFSECDPVHLQLLAFSAVRESHAAGTRLMEQGATTTAAQLVLSGTITLSTREQGSFGTAGPGALLGEMAMIGSLPCTVTATAADDVTTARIDRELFMRIAREFPGFGTAVFEALGRKLDMTMSQFEEARQVFEKARSFGGV